ncbi:MAG: hypothetical protein WBX27_04355, partial [Specibacter sp.]
AYAEAVPEGLTRAPASSWGRWFVLSAAAGIVVGIAWWLAAPGGAFYGVGTDYTIWFPRDLMLGGLGVLAGLVAAVLLVRTAGSQGAGAMARLLAVIAGGLLGSVIAWRIGIFAGDLFRTPPANMPNPSIVFSLRASSVLLLWPLVTAAAVFLYTFVAYVLTPAPRGN